MTIFAWFEQWNAQGTLKGPQTGRKFCSMTTRRCDHHRFWRYILDSPSQSFITLCFILWYKWNYFHLKFDKNRHYIYISVIFVGLFWQGGPFFGWCEQAEVSSTWFPTRSGGEKYIWNISMQWSDHQEWNTYTVKKYYTNGSWNFQSFPILQWNLFSIHVM